MLQSGPAGAVVGVAEVEQAGVGAERLAAAGAGVGGVVAGDQLGPQPVVGRVVAALLAGCPGRLADAMPGAATDQLAAAEAGSGQVHWGLRRRRAISSCLQVSHRSPHTMVRRQAMQRRWSPQPDLVGERRLGDPPCAPGGVGALL